MMIGQLCCFFFIFQSFRICAFDCDNSHHLRVSCDLEKLTQSFYLYTSAFHSAGKIMEKLIVKVAKIVLLAL